MMETTDYLVVGAGPAGSAAAVALRKEGMECVVVDRARFPRVKLCGGLLTGKAQGVLRELLGEEKYGECMEYCVASRERKFSLWESGVGETGGLCGEDVGTCEEDGAMCAEKGGERCGGKPRLLVEVEPRGEIVLIDRPRFDEWMVGLCRSLGAEVVEDDGVVDVDFDGRVARLASGREIGYGNLIAADGANGVVERLMARRGGGCESAVRGACAQTKRREAWDGKRGNSLCLEVNVDREDCPDAEGVQIHFGVVPRSYAWSFAKGDKVCLGLVKLDGVEMDVQGVFRRFLRCVGVRNVEKYPLRGAMIPFGNYMRCPAAEKEGVMYVGDAARLVEPLTGEGIFYALQSGVYAARSGGDAGRYLRDVARLHRLIDKGGRYQRWLMGSAFHGVMCRHAHKHPGFIEHFYSTQIERACLDGFVKIVWKYKRGK